MEDDLRRLIARRERIRHHNRNVLQSGAVIAGTWGVIGGTDGVLAIARALQQRANGDPALIGWANWYLENAGWLGVGISSVFGLILLVNVALRQFHEHQWHKDLERIKGQALLEKLLELSE